MPTLSWLTREQDIRGASAAPYRLLEETGRYGDGNPDNMIVQGDNLDGLKALLPYYAGKVKCVYIDPPYNTGSAFEHYDDNMEHSKWLALIYPRLELLKELLSDDGSIWASCDDNEGHYLKVIMDEIFGRNNFITTCTWQQRTTRENRKVFSEDCERIIIHAKNYQMFCMSRNMLSLTNDIQSRYKNIDNDQRGAWQSVSVNAQAGHGTPSQFYDLIAPNGKIHKLPPGRCWLYTKEIMQQKIADRRIWFGISGNNVPREKKFLSEVTKGVTPNTLWLAADAGTNDEAKKEILALFGNNIFDTPKPERLIQRILHIATNPGDLVLDSFLGSGTTAAVAHKMGRHYIGIEIGEHAITHCVPRLQKVIDSEQGGISKAVNWQGGSGFRFYRLGESVFDENGAIRKNVSFKNLAAHIWFSETGIPLEAEAENPLLGVHKNIAYYLLYNGILGDKRPGGGNVLTTPVLQTLPPHAGQKIIYGERSMLSQNRLKELNIIFRQTPYDIRGAKES